MWETPNNAVIHAGNKMTVMLHIERRMNKFSRKAGIAAFIWRLILTTGTGSIFGLLVARHNNAKATKPDKRDKGL
jgi:hypothetical protein